MPLPHLNREFDYLVPAEFDEAAAVGVRVRVRFAGRLVDGFIVGRVAASDHPGKLGYLDRVVSAERVLTPEIVDLVAAVAHRYAGTRADVLRLAVPPRHAKVEAEPVVDPPKIAAPEVDLDAWASYTHGAAFLDAVAAGRNPRAAWQVLPGEDWPARIAELAGTCAASGRSALVVVPDQRDLDRVAAACEAVNGTDSVVALSAGLGPAKRYRRWLSALRREVSIVVGTRSAVFAPVRNLGLIVLWDDGDDGYAEPRSPYPHAREIALLRAHGIGCSAVLAGHARTAEAEALVDAGWAHDLLAPRAVVRERQPHVVALADSDHALARDPGARAARLPAIAFDAARNALKNGLGVLVQVPRGGYVPSLACGKCRNPARCRRCNGPLALPSAPGADGAGTPTCRWCGIADANHRCTVCGSRTLRAVVIGAHRTAEELGRAFPGVPVHTSGGATVLDSVASGASLVISTVGAEPSTPGGYGAALLLDGWALLGRADLRAAEETLRRWMTAGALVRAGAAAGWWWWRNPRSRPSRRWFGGIRSDTLALSSTSESRSGSRPLCMSPPSMDRAQRSPPSWRRRRYQMASRSSDRSTFPRGSDIPRAGDPGETTVSTATCSVCCCVCRAVRVPLLLALSPMRRRCAVRVRTPRRFACR